MPDDVTGCRLDDPYGSGPVSFYSKVKIPDGESLFRITLQMLHFVVTTFQRQLV